MTYLTLRQWERGEPRRRAGVRVVASGRGWRSTRRRAPADRPAARVRRRRALRTCCATGAATTWSTPPPFPYFSLLAAAPRGAVGRYRLVVDWHEVWTREYWREYLGRVGGAVGNAVQALCVRVPQRAFCFSRLHARPAARGRPARPVTVLEGEYAGTLEPPDPRRPSRSWSSPAATSRRSACPRSCPRSRGRERRMPDAARRDPRRRPERAAVLAAIARAGLADASTRRASSTPPRWRRPCGARSAWCCPRGARATAGRRRGGGAGTPSVVVRGPGQRRRPSSSRTA